MPQMKVECVVCKRYFFKDSDVEVEGVSSTTCARCHCITYIKETDLGEDFFLNPIIEELQGNRPEWQGEDQSNFSEKELKWYKRVVQKAEGKIREKEGTGEERK